MQPNILGLDVSGLDTDAFLRSVRLAFPIAALLFLAVLLRVRRAGFLLLGVLGANAFVWLVTNYPLARLYALDTSADRMNNLAMCQVVATGNTPLETWVVGQTHFGLYGRPYVMFWTLLVSALSGFDPERLLRLYGFLPLLMSCGFALALYFGLGPERDGFWSPWQRALVAGFATLLASAPMDFMGPYGVPWALMFLLKPNHALGLVLFPLLLRAFADIGSWRGRVAVGLLLHLLGWAFALHMAYVVAGLLLFTVLSWLFRRAGFRRDLLDTLVVVGINLAVVGPYLVRLALAPRPPAALVPEPAELALVSVSTPMLLEATLRTGLLFPAALWGSWRAWRDGGRLGRLLAAQLGAALLLWLGYAGMALAGNPRGPWSQLFEQPDEIFHWLRFVAAACAGVGAWDVAQRFCGAFLPSAAPAARAAVVALVSLPSSLPYWWSPNQTDRYFVRSREPLSQELRRFSAFLLRETPPSAVLAGDPWLMPFAAALAGRRSLISMGLPPPADVGRRQELTRSLLSGADAAAVLDATSRYGVSHVVVTPRLLSALKLPGLRPEGLEARSDLVRVFAGQGPEFGFIRVYRIGRSGSGR